MKNKEDGHGNKLLDINFVAKLQKQISEYNFVTTTQHKKNLFPNQFDRLGSGKV